MIGQIERWLFTLRVCAQRLHSQVGLCLSQNNTQTGVHFRLFKFRVNISNVSIFPMFLCCPVYGMGFRCT